MLYHTMTMNGHAIHKNQGLLMHELFQVFCKQLNRIESKMDIILSGGSRLVDRHPNTASSSTLGSSHPVPKADNPLLEDQALKALCVLLKDPGGRGPSDQRREIHGHHHPPTLGATHGHGDNPTPLHPHP